MEGDCPFLPFEIWCRILPHSFESVRAGLHLGLVCRAWRDESRHVEFWRVWLEARRKALLEFAILSAVTFATAGIAPMALSKRSSDFGIIPRRAMFPSNSSTNSCIVAFPSTAA